jgi:hypothetical protein
MNSGNCQESFCFFVGCETMCKTSGTRMPIGFEVVNLTERIGDRLQTRMDRVSSGFGSLFL